MDEGQAIVQESIIGSTYRLSYRAGDNGGVIPSITGNAYVMSVAELVFQPDDPFRNGIVI
nr:proline racemase family protein [Marinicella sp. W31]MDC2880207.1 proline racemase family protein [Marinicella sp. W31]